MPSITELDILPNQFFTLQSMFTLTGATGVVFVICNGLQAAFQFNPKWLGLVISLLLSIFTTYLSCGAAGKDHAGGIDYIVGIVNGFLIYATATGTTQILGSNNTTATTSPPGTHRLEEQGFTKNYRKFLTSWW
jgi:uncharacterized membrane protein